MHDPIAAKGRRPRSGVTGFFDYNVMVNDFDAVAAFRYANSALDAQADAA